jgi:hypothetical protein
MAEVARRTTIKTDRLLDSLRGEWSVGLDTASHWDALSDYEQEVFIETWAIPRGYYRLLRERSERGELTAAEEREFQQIQTWIDQTRASIEAVLEDSAI